MRLILPTALAMGLITTGCLFGGNSNAPGSQPQPVTDSPWKVSLTSTCEHWTDEYCVGMYGFSVSANQKWEIGPAPGHQTAVGYLTDEEFISISALVKQIPLNQIAAESCIEEEEAVDNEEKLVLSRGELEKQISKSDPSQFCHHTANADVARRLHDAIHQLAEKYYQVPFPDACAEAVLDVAALYSPLQACAHESDCVYVNTNYEAIPPGGPQLVITDNCSRVRPIVVANAVALAGAKDKLLAGFAHAQDVCGQRLVRDDCMGVSGFQSSGGDPVCQQGFCRMNPGISSTR